MLKNYIKIAWRSLSKNKSTFAINVTGLALGIASCLIISLFVMDELSYDRFNEKSERIVRVILNGRISGEELKESKVMAPVAKTLVNELPGVISSTRIANNTDNFKVKMGEKLVGSGNLAFVDPNFFEVFTLPLIAGDSKTALSKPNTVILSKTQAQKYFGDANPLNRNIEIQGIGYYDAGYHDLSGTYTVTGIIEPVPSNSHFHFDVFVSMLGNPDADNQQWLSGSYATYLLLDRNADIEKLQAQLPAIAKKYMSDQLKEAMGMDFNEFVKKGNQIGLILQPLTEIHLYSDIKSGSFEAGGDIKTVYIFTIVAIFMLLIACINFMNLSTASATKRLKEIGMRKVLGSNKIQLIFQFLTESMLLTVFSMTAGLVILILTLPIFNKLADNNLTVDSLYATPYILSIFVLTLIIGILAGGYPAFFMSSFQPIDSLKKRIITGKSKGLRSSLVVFQFAISVFLIIGSIVVSRQMNYIQTKNIGYDRDNLIVLREAGKLGSNFEAFKNELKNDARIKNLTNSAFIPAGPTDSNSQTISPEDDPSVIRRVMLYGIDEDYLETLGMKLLVGRNFSNQYVTEENNVIINERAAKFLGIYDNPIGKTFEKHLDNHGGRQQLKVIGMIKDFHSRSLRMPIEPLMMIYNPYYSLIIKSNASNTKNLLADIERKWNDFGTGEAFHYAFLDELYNETYTKEANLNYILRIFAFLTILVACLGLLGLVTFSTEQRVKEIGIRKTMGSSVIQIVGLLTKDFLKLIAISLLLAFPLGYYFMSKWLQDFEYRTDIPWWVFVISGAITLVIALVTIGFKSIKAAVMNPVKSLRSE
ncbi:ABC transporter permease [Dyadobacter tibetensis]|uniref:ABC transporter permease n=1 Tax=Dyadobacter tibetensis TaxID=1211851 RepID=UPI00046EB996|nr:ABC transporter permease [Dyadobacter tibetensis]